MLPPGAGPLAGGLKEDSRFVAELFLRIVGRGRSDIGGLDREMAAGKPAMWVRSRVELKLVMSELGYVDT